MYLNVAPLSLVQLSSSFWFTLTEKIWPLRFSKLYKIICWRGEEFRVFLASLLPPPKPSKHFLHTKDRGFAASQRASPCCLETVGEKNQGPTTQGKLLPGTSPQRDSASRST